MPKTIAICGAGIIGVTAAYFISKANSNYKVILIDKIQPMSFTSSKSGENFRDYWPHPCMEQLSSRSIELMENLRSEFGEDSFEMDFSGYHFVSHNRNKNIFADDNSDEFMLRNQVETNSENIQKVHPYLDNGIQKSVFIQKAGHLDSYAMGSLFIREAKKMGMEMVQGEILNIEHSKNQFEIKLDSNQTIQSDKIVIAAGPFLNYIAKMVGIEFPIWNTLQRKFIMPDPLKIIPSNMPFTIYSDGQFLDWSEEEKAFFQSEEKYHRLLQKFPGAIHIKPEPGGKLKMGWAFQTENVRPTWEIPDFEFFPQIVLKGASRFIPQLKIYENNIPTPIIEYAGHYTRTPENWPLIGPTIIENVYVIGALAGFGTMTSCAAGELCANHIFEKNLPDYAEYFHPNRYRNPKILKEIEELDSDGQL